MSTKSTYATFILIGVGIAGFAAAQPLASEGVSGLQARLKGRIPSSAFKDGAVDLSQVPDYVVVYGGGDAVIGYAKKTDLFDNTRINDGSPVVVLDETLSIAIGHMVDGQGFVPLGSVIETVSPAGKLLK